MATIDLIQLGRTFIAYGQYNKAEAILRSYLQQDAESTAAIDLLISIYRTQGKLNELPPLHNKLAILRSASATPPEISEVGKFESDRQLGLAPAPFLVVHDPLDEPTIETLLNMAQEHMDTFRKSRIKATDPTGLAPERRKSLQLHIDSIYEKLAMLLGSFVHREFENCCTRFAIPIFAISSIEYKYCCYPNGSYFDLHRDDNIIYQSKDGNTENAKRRISFAYYFHRLPKAFSGGDLLVHDTDRLNNRYSIDRYLKISPENNTLVFFPSWFFHQVTEVKESTGDLLNGRFAINGHVSLVESNGMPHSGRAP